jgi:hypothetical protein
VSRDTLAVLPASSPRVPIAAVLLLTSSMQGIFMLGLPAFSAFLHLLSSCLLFFRVCVALQFGASKTRKPLAHKTCGIGGTVCRRAQHGAARPHNGGPRARGGHTCHTCRAAAASATGPPRERACKCNRHVHAFCPSQPAWFIAFAAAAARMAATVGTAIEGRPTNFKTKWELS